MTRSPGALLVGAALAVLSATALVPARAAGVTVSSQNLTPLRSCVVTATPATTTSVLDSRVQQANATTNYGTATGTTVQSASSANIRTYVEFSLSGCSPAIPSTATVRLATLRLYVTARSAVCRTLDVFTATVSWTESAITWNNQPFGTTLNNPASGSRVASFNVGNIAGCQNQALGYAAGATVTGAVAVHRGRHREQLRLDDPRRRGELGHHIYGDVRRQGARHSQRVAAARGELRGRAVSALPRVARRLVSLTLWVALAVLVAGWALFLRPQVLGGSTTFVVVHGNSMLPRHVTGDLVVLRREPTYRVHEVIAYRVPKGQLGADAIVIHRIIGGDGSTGFTLKGDNNPAPDPWHPRTADVVGTEMWHVPSLGAVLARLRTPAVMGALAAAIAAAVVVTWHPSQKRRGVGTLPG